MSNEIKKENSLLLMLLEKNQAIETLVAQIEALQEKIQTLTEEGKDDDGGK